MKINNANISPLSTSSNATDQSGRVQSPRGSSDAAHDDVHFSELVRSLRSLAAESPERQERIEQIARAYANGTYQVDAEATAAKIVDDARRYR